VSSMDVETCGWQLSMKEEYELCRTIVDPWAGWTWVAGDGSGLGQRGWVGFVGRVGGVGGWRVVCVWGVLSGGVRVGVGGLCWPGQTRSRSSVTTAGSGSPTRRDRGERLDSVEQCSDGEMQWGVGAGKVEKESKSRFRCRTRGCPTRRSWTSCRRTCGVCAWLCRAPGEASSKRWRKRSTNNEERVP
jgi:hypothetical protein